MAHTPHQRVILGSYPMRVGQSSESDAVDALRLPFYISQHARGSHVQGNHFDLGIPVTIGLTETI